MGKKNLYLFLIFGCVYTTLEVFFKGFKNIDTFGIALIGYTSIWMFLIGGIATLLVGMINEKFKIHLLIEMLIGGLIITSVELISGSILSLFNIELWTYEDMYFNYKGIVCLEFSLLWCCLVPCIHYLDDVLRSYIKIRK